MTTPAIEAHDLTKHFGDLVAVDHLSLSVARGEIFGLLGRNGSGKSTTVRMLTTLLRPTSGTATVAGYDVYTRPNDVRRSSGVTLQDPALDPNMSGREHLTLIGRLLLLGKRKAASRADELLVAFGLSGAADRRIGTYSGGMQRRLDIATALFSRPPVLFLDEPTTGLDPQSRRALWDEIHLLRAGGTTVLLTTQYLEEADQLADRIGVIDGGKLIAGGTPRELRAEHGLRTVTLPGEHHAPTVAAAVTTGPVTARDGLTTVEVRPDASLDEALAQIRSVIGSLDGVSVTSASLEDVFVHLTGRDINSAPARRNEGAAA
ncbi:MAG: ATP-binding cassette domain-containing protein [Mycobacteriales bacterium]